MLNEVVVDTPPHYIMMHVDAIDILKEYSHNYRSLRILVQVTDGRGYSVTNCSVRVMFRYNDQLTIYRCARTDHYGIADFHLFNIRRGRWSFYVLGIDHEFYGATDDSLPPMREIVL